MDRYSPLLAEPLLSQDEPRALNDWGANNGRHKRLPSLRYKIRWVLLAYVDPVVKVIHLVCIYFIQRLKKRAETRLSQLQKQPDLPFTLKEWATKHKASFIFSVVKLENEYSRNCYQIGIFFRFRLCIGI